MNEDNKITTTYTRGSWKRRVTDEDIKGHLDTALLMDNLVKAEMVSMKATTPTDMEINETVDRILGDSDLMTRIDELVINDTKAAINQHRLDTANEYIESRKENMLPEHYNDLKYILNECDLESGW